MSEKIYIGRREWCALPNLKIPWIKAKIDTGAKTSALHAENIERVRNRVRFLVKSTPNKGSIGEWCEENILEERTILSSNGQPEKRYVIQTSLAIGAAQYLIELSLTNRHLMRFNLLLGREALNQFALIDPSKTYLLRKPK